jgi:hypothetical protein
LHLTNSPTKYLLLWLKSCTRWYIVIKSLFQQKGIFCIGKIAEASCALKMPCFGCLYMWFHFKGPLLPENESIPEKLLTPHGGCSVGLFRGPLTWFNFSADKVAPVYWDGFLRLRNPKKVKLIHQPRCLDGWTHGGEQRTRFTSLVACVPSWACHECTKKSSIRMKYLGERSWLTALVVFSRDLGC